MDVLLVVVVVRGVCRQELLRIAFADLFGMLDVADVCQAISDIIEATLDVVLQVVWRVVVADRGFVELLICFVIIAMGCFGGVEISYGFDVDVMFVYELVDLG